MHQVFTSWSGGKDSCLACHLALANGLRVRYLLNMITEDGQRSWTHGQSSQLLQAQAQAIGIPLVQKQTTRTDYENTFKEVLRSLKREGVSGGVFGDIDLEVHRDWVEGVCNAADVKAYLPLWGQAQDKILENFVASGFEAVVVAARAEFFGEEWLGRKVDPDFLSHLAELKQKFGVQPCGEAGEYHTFVTDGPLFNQRVEILEANKVLREGHRFLEISKYALRAKH